MTEKTYNMYRAILDSHKAIGMGTRYHSQDNDDYTMSYEYTGSGQFHGARLHVRNRDSEEKQILAMSEFANKAGIVL